MIHLVTDPLDVLDSPRNRRTAEFIFFAEKDSAFGDLAVGDPVKKYALHHPSDDFYSRAWEWTT